MLGALLPPPRKDKGKGGAAQSAAAAPREGVAVTPAAGRPKRA